MSGIGVVLAVGAALLASASTWLFLDGGVRAALDAAALRARKAATDLRECRSRFDVEGLERIIPGYESRKARRLRGRCLDELPELMDVVALGLSAGISFDAALGLYCDRYKTMLSKTLGDARDAWRLGLTGRRDGLRGIAADLGVDEFRVFVETVTESLEFGAPLASVLVSQAAAVRESRRSVVAERIEKTPVKLLVPTGTLILPAMLLAILGPLVASMATGGP